LVPEVERCETMTKMRTIFEDKGYAHDPTRGSSLGQLKKKDRNGISILVIKPDSSTGRAASIGAEYEMSMAQEIRQKYAHHKLVVKTAGFEHGSDLQIISPNGKKMNIELKTTCSADYGQFSLGYDITRGKWEPLLTKGYLKNAKLFADIFDSLSPQLNSKGTFEHPLSEVFQVKNNLIVGLRAHNGTGSTKDRLSERWFGERKELKKSLDFKKAACYYQDKGEHLIQIRGRGVFLLKECGLEGFPLFFEEGTSSYVRFRIKPAMGRNGAHRFVVAIKLSIRESEKDLDREADLKEVIEFLIKP